MTHPVLKYINVKGRQFLDPTQRSIEPVAGTRGLASYGIEIKKVDEERRRVYAVMSSRSLDRYGEIVEPSAAKEFLPRFLDNPVMLKDHDHWSPIGHWEEVKITKDTIEGWAVFAEGNTDAEERWALVKAGSVKAFSIGFIVHEWEMVDEVIDGQKQKVRVFTKIEIIECSSVAVPANPDAHVKGDGIAPDSIEPEALVAALVKALANPAVVKALADAITPHQANTIKQQLSADPGGPMATLMQDFVELLQEAGIHGVEREVTPPDPPSKRSAGHAALDYLGVGN
ncbi:MAG: HK97 family phage prohead protease [Planctomycetota bacterium]